jgi:hypothetical protein
MMSDFDCSKSLQELDGKDWGEPTYDSHPVTECHRLRRVPLRQFTAENLRIIVKFPKHVKHRGKTLATIYRPARTYPSYRVAWTVAGKRKMKAFRSYDEAKEHADELVRPCEEFTGICFDTAPCHSCYCSPGSFAAVLSVHREKDLPFESGIRVLRSIPETRFNLQSTTNLVSSVVWTTNPNPSPPVVVNGQNTVTNPISGTRKFYRLSQ